MEIIIDTDVDHLGEDVKMKLSNNHLDNMNFIELNFSGESIGSETFRVSVEDLHMALLPFIELQKRQKAEIDADTK